MSALQEKAKPHLIPLIEGNWPALSKEAQSALAAWAAMFTMVVEYADPRTVAIPQLHRIILMETGRCPPDWHIWIGRHDPQGRHPAWFNHLGAPHQIITDLGVRDTVFIQGTGFTVGQTLFQAIMISPPYARLNKSVFSDAYDLRMIEPFDTIISDSPNKKHDYFSRQEVSNVIAPDIGFKSAITTKPI